MFEQKLADLKGNVVQKVVQIRTAFNPPTPQAACRDHSARVDIVVPQENCICNGGSKDLEVGLTQETRELH